MNGEEKKTSSVEESAKPDEIKKTEETGMKMDDTCSNSGGSKLSFKVVAGIGGLFLVIGLVISYITAVAVKETSGVNFCSSCHSMKPMATAYLNSVHGGFGESGFVAQCADCHLPHESLIGYLVQKARTGIHDVVTEVTADTFNIDWKEKREERRNFLYDSSCLHCHENLLRATKPNKKAYLAHKAYFSGKLKVEVEHKKVQAMCVDCHKYVGHYELGKELDKIGTVYDEDYYNYKRDKPNYAAEEELASKQAEKKVAEEEAHNEHH
ncbi:cytochrome c3 family protein [Nitrosophilus alvini]|uniref:cytochrome c3 family protein n=1 Tax=Nitrosophilus alvini TaxID=2714855 RepID=UPI00190E0102|nr:NapC/NirT family cytochrome c [Nitrosophilus alvini]